MRLVVIQRLGLFRLAEVVAAVTAESIFRKNFGGALRAGKCEFPSTLSAETSCSQDFPSGTLGIS